MNSVLNSLNDITSELVMVIKEEIKSEYDANYFNLS